MLSLASSHRCYQMIIPVAPWPTGTISSLCIPARAYILIEHGRGFLHF